MNDPRLYVLVYGRLGFGGIETLILRLVKYLLDCDHRVVLCITDLGVSFRVDPRAEVVLYSSISDLVRQVRSKQQMFTDDSIIMLSFDPISCARAMAIETDFTSRGSIVHLSGIFHPRAFFMTGERRDRRLLNRALASALGFESLFFMNDECRKSHEQFFRRPLHLSPVIPLPIEAKNRRWQPFNRDRLRVISVGRLVDFKAYNLGLFEVVAECEAAGVAVDWDVFGDGPLREIMAAKIENGTGRARVELCGALDYKRFDETVTEYDAFVGMGTAALEAAALGVPTICAVIDDPGRTYGFVHQLPFGNIGELQAESPRLNISEVLVSLAHLERGELETLSGAESAAVEGYTLPRFVAELHRVTRSVSLSWTRRWRRRLMAYVYRLLTESSAANVARRTLRGYADLIR